MDNTSPTSGSDSAIKGLDEMLSLTGPHRSGENLTLGDPAVALSQQVNELGMNGTLGSVERLGVVVGKGLLHSPVGAIETVKQEGWAGVGLTAAESVAVGLGLRLLMSKAAPVGAAASFTLGALFAIKSVPKFYDSISAGLHAHNWNEMDAASRTLGQATGGLVVDSMIGFGGYKLGSGLGGRLRFGVADASPVVVTNDVDGRLLAETAASRDFIANKFAPITEADKPLLRIKLQQELEDVRAIGPNGEQTSAYESLMQDSKLSAAQKENVLDNLGLVREHYASYRQGERMHHDPEVNWIHTQGELAKVLEVGRAKNLSADEMEDSLLASMYSDSVKFSVPNPEGTTPNFHTHHLDGALAAEYNLRRQGFPEERIDRIVEAVLAHQIAPPNFMGMLYELKISGSLEAMIKAGKVGPEEGQAMKETLAQMTHVGSDGIKRIGHLANVNQAPRMTNADGMQQVAFTPQEQKVFALSGTDRWILPYESACDPQFASLSAAEQAARLSRGKIARNVVDGDGVDNYGTSGGASKIDALRGPLTIFRDPTLWHSIESVDASFRDAYTVLTPEGKAMADQSWRRRDKITNQNDGLLQTYMNGWLRSTKNLDVATDVIPFYNTPLHYPNPGENATAKEMADIMLAKEIRAEAVNFLRRDHRTGHDLPGTFEAVRGTGN